LGEGAGLVVGVPVHGRTEAQALCGIETDGVDHVDLDAERRQNLTGFSDAEFLRLLDQIAKVGTRVCDADDLRAGSLGLQELRGKVGGAERMQDRPYNLAASALDEAGRVILVLLAERIV